MHNISHESECHQSAIIDEIDSDTDHGGGNFAYKTASTMRNISIMSVSEDESSQCGDFGYTQEISIEESQRNIKFDDGYAQVKVTKITLEEQSVELGELGEIQENTIDDAQKIVFDNLDRKNKKNAQLGNIIEADNEKINKRQKGSKFNIEYQCEVINDSNPALEKAISNDIIENQSFHALLANRENIDELTNEIKSPEYGNDNLSNRHDKGKEFERTEDDDEVEALFKRSKQQRSVLNEIIEGKPQQATINEELNANDVMISTKRNIISSGKIYKIQIYSLIHVIKSIYNKLTFNYYYLAQ